MPAFKLLGFAPDADPTTPGVLVECEGLIPTDRGMVTAPNPATPIAVTTPLPSNVSNAAYLTKQGIGVVYAKVAAGGLYMLYGDPPTGWTDVSRAGGYAHDFSWSMASYGPNLTLAVNGAGANLMQEQAVFGAFADVAAAPSANLLVVANRFAVLLGHTAPGATTGYVPDGWYCCARDDHTDWDPNVATLCGFGRVPGVTGWTAAIEFADSIYAFTRDGMYRGDFVGAAEGIWKFTKTPHKAGCQNANAVTKTDTSIVFLASDNLYLYDGATLTGLMDGAVKRWFAQRYYPFGAIEATTVRYDRLRNCIWVMFPTSTGDILTLVYHLGTGKWGCGIKNVMRTLIEADQLLTQGLRPTVFGFRMSGHQIVSLDGSYEAAGGGSSPACTTWDFGDDSANVEIPDSRLRFATTPPTTTCRPYTRKSLGEALTAGSVVTRTAEGKFELRQAAPSAQWHRHVYTFNGHAEVTHLWLPVKPAGDRK